MKTKLLFYAFQKFKNSIKHNSIISFLIIFFMTVTSFSQENGILFNCDGGTITFGPSGGTDVNGNPYWIDGTDSFGTTGFYTLYAEDQSDGSGGTETVWALRNPGSGPAYPDTGYIPGIRFFYLPVADGSICTGTWLYDLVLCGSLTVTYTWYQDLDSDTYGNHLVSQQSGTQPAGYVADNTDCDDNQLLANPGLDEIPFDTIDNDCDGEIDEDDNPPTVYDFCDDEEKKVLICHNGKTKCVSINAVDAHLAHYDELGSCDRFGDWDNEDIKEVKPTTYEAVSWPNPSNNLFNVKMITPNSIDMVDLKTFDINGRLIHSNIINGNEDYQFGEQLSSGIYFVRLSQADITKVIKLIKQ